MFYKNFAKPEGFSYVTQNQPYLYHILRSRLLTEVPVRQHHNQVHSRLNNKAKKIMRKEQFYVNYNGAFSITGAHFGHVM